MIFVVGVPTIVSMLWFAAFGGAAIHIELFGGGGLAEKVFGDVSAALFAFFEYFPATGCAELPDGVPDLHLPGDQR